MRLLNYTVEAGDPNGPSEIAGEISISEAHPFAGKRHYRVPSTASAISSHRALWKLAGTANNRFYYPRVYFYIPASPSAADILLAFGNFASGFYGELILQTDRSMRLRRNGSVNVGELSPILSVGWHYLELAVKHGTATNNGFIQGRIDGEAFASSSTANLGTGLAPDQLRVGIVNSTGGSGGITLDFDEIALNDDQGAEENSFPGVLNPESPPVVITGAADGIGGAIATLHGKVNPKGLPTKYWFEYGTDKTYGSQTAAIEAGDGEEFINVASALANLKPKTVYHFRLVAENAIDEAIGEDGTFETGVGPSGEPVVVSFLADHEGANPLEEYGSSGIFEKEGVPQGTLSSFSPGYGGGKALLATTTAADSYARGIAIKTQTGWKIGQDVYTGCAVWFPKGFFEAMKGQVDILRWDNFDQDGLTTERGGIVIQTGERRFRFVRIKEGEPDEQHSFNLEGEIVIGPELEEERWYFPEFYHRLWHEDYLAINRFYLDNVLLSTSNDRNCTRSDLEVSRLRAGIVATSSKQTNPLSLVVDDVYSGPVRRGPRSIIAPQAVKLQSAASGLITVKGTAALQAARLQTSATARIAADAVVLTDPAQVMSATSGRVLRRILPGQYVRSEGKWVAL